MHGDDVHPSLVPRGTEQAEILDARTQLRVAAMILRNRGLSRFLFEDEERRVCALAALAVARGEGVGDQRLTPRAIAEAVDSLAARMFLDYLKSAVDARITYIDHWVYKTNDVEVVAGAMEQAARFCKEIAA